MTRVATRSLELESATHEALYDWMQRTPWLAVSLALHLLCFFVLAAVPWHALSKPPQRVIETAVVTPEPEPFLPPPEELPPPEVLDPVPIEAEPVELAPAEPDDLVDPLPALDTRPVARDTVLDLTDPSAVIGLGGGPRGGPGTRGFSGGGGSPASEAAVRDALDWLARHQGEGGGWDADGFGARCEGDPCSGPGLASHDVGVSALALLAFLGSGHTTQVGEHRATVSRGLRWLVGRQAETGLVGERSSREFLYDHAIATLALCEALFATGSPVLRTPARRALAFLESARDPVGAWRYDVPSIGDADTSVTGWAVFALAAGRDAGLEVDPAALHGARVWLEQVTDPTTGRVGYDARGTTSSRTPANRAWPVEKGEAMTAVGVLTRLFLGDRPALEPTLERGADLVARRPPRWEPEARGCDMYYWYYGTYALYQLGGRRWRAWEAALEEAVLGAQRRSGDARGSWDPVGPWGHAGGRVYSTALLTLTMEVYYRSGHLLGAR